jgi:hypothetical protein
MAVVAEVRVRAARRVRVRCIVVVVWCVAVFAVWKFARWFGRETIRDYGVGILDYRSAEAGSCISCVACRFGSGLVNQKLVVTRCRIFDCEMTSAVGPAR